MAELDTIDLHGTADFLPNMPTVSGRVALLHVLQRRLTTEHGRISFWPDFGTDLRQFLLSKSPPTRIAAAAVAECLQDERVDDCRAIEARRSDDGKTVYLTLGVTDAEGPFTFTLAISDAALELISLQEAA